MLQVGQKFSMNGKVFTVEHVNASRAHCVAREPTAVTIRDRTFHAHHRVAIDIAATTDLAVLAEVERR